MKRQTIKNKMLHAKMHNNQIKKKLDLKELGYIMTELTCISKNRNNFGVYGKYILKDANDNIIKKSTVELIDAIRNGEINVDNLELTSKGTLRNKKDKLKIKDAIILFEYIKDRIIYETHKTVVFKDNTNIDLLEQKARALYDNIYIDKIDEELIIIKTFEKIIVATPKSKFVMLDAVNFFKWSTLREINLMNVDTSYLIDMGFMFYCAKASKININNINTSKVAYMDHMFFGCNLIELTIGNIDTSKVTDASEMFAESSMNKLDLSRLNLNNIIITTRMFEHTRIKEIDISNFDLTHTYYNQYMFRNCNIDILKIGNIEIDSNLIDNFKIFHKAKIGTLIIKSAQEETIQYLKQKLGSDTTIVCKHQK